MVLAAVPSQSFQKRAPPCRPPDFDFVRLGRGPEPTAVKSLSHDPSFMCSPQCSLRPGPTRTVHRVTLGHTGSWMCGSSPQ